MASFLPQPTLIFDRLEAAIRDTFNELLAIVNHRRDELLTELNTYKLLYLESERIRLEKLQDLESLIGQLNNAQITHNTVQNLQKEFLNDTQEELKNFQLPTLMNVQAFDLDGLDDLKGAIQGFGSIEPPPYSDKVNPRLEFGPKGRNPGELRLPLGIEVDTDSIYVADLCNKRVQVFNMAGSFKSKFGWGKLVKPHGIAVKDNFIFVTDSELNIIQKYEDLSYFRFDRRVRELGEKFKFVDQSYEILDFPLGISVSDESVYVADCNSNQIAVFDLDLVYVNEIGNGKLKSPRDVKFHGEEVYVLDQSTPFHVHAFKQDGSHVNSFINLKGGDSALFMCIDAMDNILISDGASSTIQIFDKLGNILHVIATKQPSGIAVHHCHGIISARKYGKKQLALY